MMRMVYKEYTFPVSNRTLQLCINYDISLKASRYLVRVYNGYKPRQDNFKLHEDVWYINEQKFYRILNNWLKKVSVDF